MKITLFLALSALAAPQVAAEPRLTVVISVDQMRADYLGRYSREYLGGLARLAKEGAVFTNARHGHVPTETSPGHASLATGCSPDEHGIVANTWWDRKSGQPMYSVDDPEHGRSPVNLLCDTLGDVLKAASPKSQSVSISGKDRAAILMGGHKPDLVLWYDSSAGQFVSSGYYGRMPDWVWNWDAQLHIPVEQRSAVASLPLMDAMTLELARRAIEEQNLGAGSAPDLLSISLSVTDTMGHAVGPDSVEMHNQLVSLDRELGLFFEYLDRRFGRGQYLLALSSDHGVLPVPESETGKKMGASRLWETNFKAPIEAALSRKFGAPPLGKTWILAVNPPHLYLNLPLAKEKGVDAAVLRKEAARATAENPAVVRVYTAEQLAAGKASGPFAAVFERGFFPERSGDLMILFKEGVLFTSGVYTGGLVASLNPPTGTAHGTPYDYDARIPLILTGPGVRPGRYDRAVLSIDLAPTLARFLGLRFPPRRSSAVLKEALDETPGRAAPRSSAPLQKALPSAVGAR